jgi:diguanylate cyclase (GGDEF)-like protein/PAS domain S-box-containing protein
MNPNNPGSVANGKARALVVSADAEDCSLIQPVLAEYGFAPVALDRADRALFSLREYRFALVVVDVDVQDNGGLDLARTIKQRSPQTGIIFITKKGIFEDAVEAIRIGAYDYLPKPFTRHEVAMAVRRYRERLRLEDLAFQAQLQYDHLVQNIPIIIFTLNTVGFRLEFINRASWPVLGYRPDEAIDTPDWLLFIVHPEDRDEVRRILKESPVCDEGFSFQCRLRHKKGHTVHAIIRSMPCPPGLTSREGELVDGVVLDITERVLLEQTLVQDEKLKTLGAISAEMAHEIRNPLMSIGGFARKLHNRARLAAEKTSASQPDHAMEAEIILRETRRLERLLDRINNYMRPLRIFRQACSCERVLTDCANLLYPELQNARVSLTMGLDQDLPTIFADPDILGQVFLNIMLHCLNTTPPDKRLQVSASSVHDLVEVNFCHTIRASASVDPDKIFLPFEEGGNAGLPLSHKLVQSMGGTLTFSRNTESACFCLTLPRETGPAANVMRELDALTPDDIMPLTSPQDFNFESQLEREWRRSVRDVRPISALVVDVDRFEGYLAKYGRKKAHEMLGTINTTLTDILKRPGDFYASFGSQQYSVILPDTNDLGSVIVAEEIREAVVALQIPNARSDVDKHVTVCVGAASLVPGPGQSPSDLLSEASKALFIAKQRGRNKVHSTGTASQE